MAAFAIPFAVIAMGIVVVGIVDITAIAFHPRFQEYSTANCEGPSFWEGVGLVVLGILDITNIPFTVEGIVGQMQGRMTLLSYMFRSQIQSYNTDENQGDADHFPDIDRLRKKENPDSCQ